MSRTYSSDGTDRDHPADPDELPGPPDAVRGLDGEGDLIIFDDELEAWVRAPIDAPGIVDV